MYIEGKRYKTYKIDEIDRKKFIGFIYITVNKINNKKYIGQHIRWKEDYLGSGNYLKNSIKKHGIHNFERFIIDIATTQKELDDKETYYINEVFHSATSKDWYNIKSGSQSGGNTFKGLSEEDYLKATKKISEGKKGEKNPAKREDVRKKLRDNHYDCKGDKNPMHGNGHKLAGDKNGMYGNGHKLAGDKNGMAKSIIVTKDDMFYAEFSTVLPLIELVGSRAGAYKLANGWKPSKKSKFHGWCAYYK